MTLYAYHPVGWKTGETTVGVATNEFTYDAAGNLRTLKDGKNQMTYWGYDVYGRVTSKTNHNNLEILRYKYDSNDRLTNRWSNAKLNTYYAYDKAGSLTNVDYNASTDLRFTYDALGRLSTMVDAVGTTTYTYDPANRTYLEDGPWTSDVVTNRLNTAGLLDFVGVQQPASFYQVTYGYDAARRLRTVGGTSGSYTNFYHAGLNSVTAPARLVQQIGLPNSSIITNTFDNLGRLTGTYLRTSGGTTLNKHVYLYNNGHQRTKQTRQDDSYVDYLYDDASQLYSSKGYNSGGTLLTAENHGYTYDPAWNMTRRTNNLTATTYTVNALNQIAADGAWNYTYDNNGNRATRSSGTAVYYTYDDENQLVSAYTDTYYTPEASRWRTDFVYDAKMRLRRKLEYLWSGGAWAFSGETRYLYDGMRVVQERNSSNVPTVSYTRGWDLSGSFERAGGIGGLLARSSGYSSGSWTAHNFYHADGNGNVTYLVNSSQALSASYRYDPYGNLHSSSGTLASANLYRFSSKEFHPNSGLYYYGYRWYDPSLQRWLNRDPIGETGGINLYFFVRNNPLSNVDPVGFTESDISLIVRGPYQCGRAMFELLDGYLEMRKANVKGADKYFHCLAQCNASKHSPATAAALGVCARRIRYWT